MCSRLVGGATSQVAPTPHRCLVWINPIRLLAHDLHATGPIRSHICVVRGMTTTYDEAEWRAFMVACKQFKQDGTGSHIDNVLLKEFPLFHGKAPAGHPYPQAFKDGATDKDYCYIECVDDDLDSLVKKGLITLTAILSSPSAPSPIESLLRRERSFGPSRHRRQPPRCSQQTACRTRCSNTFDGRQKITTSSASGSSSRSGCSSRCSAAVSA